MTALRTLPLPTQEAERPAQQDIPTAVPSPREKPARLVSLDAYRGAIMLFMASGGLALPAVARHFPDSPVWRFLAFNTDHVAWVGCSLWDLIQPSFMFMVGVAMPYSIASRRAKGDSEPKIVAHVLYRAVFLVLLAVFLTSNWSKHTEWVFTNVLAQIGLGYAFLYVLLGRGWRVQLLALAGILLGYWLLFFLWPLPGAGFDYRAAGWTDDWQGLPGFFAHWDKNTNAAAAFDEWFLNLFPPGDRFPLPNKGGYQTLNFVPSLGTMILGLMAGEMLRTPKSKWHKLGWLLAVGAVCLTLGWLAGEFVCPIVKRIWTPSWVLYSAGWTFAMLAGFFWIIDIQGWKRWALPLVVVGMNSIAMYCMSQLMRGWVNQSLVTHLGPLALPALAHVVVPILALLNVTVDPVWLNNTFGPITQAAAVLLVLWLICWWMYRRGIFLRI